jgi:hypothetical protein
VEYHYPVEGVADLAVKLIAAKEETSDSDAVDRAIGLLDLCRNKLCQHFYHEKFAEDSYAMSLTPFGKAIKKITVEDRC